MRPARRTLSVLLALLILALLPLLAGCMPTASPNVTLHRDVHVHIANGQQPKNLRHVTANVDYHQVSETGIESAIEQTLRDVLRGELDLDTSLTQ